MQIQTRSAGLTLQNKLYADANDFVSTRIDSVDRPQILPIRLYTFRDLRHPGSISPDEDQSLNLETTTRRISES